MILKILAVWIGMVAFAGLTHRIYHIVKAGSRDPHGPQTS
jgi:hypothetical protein